MNKKISCTICDSNKTKSYVTLNSKYTIYECSNCSNAFTFPEPEIIDYEADDFHGQFKYESSAQLPQQWRSALNKQLNFIKKHISIGSNILEIGCGQGLFLELLKKAGYNEYGIEPSKSAFNIAKDKGLNVINGYFQATSFANGEFDLIIMSQVLEHIKDPITFIKSLSSLFPNKYFLLVQSNYKGLIPLLKRKSWYAWVPEQHYSHFTVSGMQSLCSMSETTLKEIEFSSLEHNNYWLSKFSNFIPSTGDQFHCLIKL